MSGPATPVDFPHGHVGHLSADQEAALTEFQKIAEQSGHYSPAKLESASRPSHDDETLLRYLRARKFVAPDALKQFIGTETWRKENNLHSVYESLDAEKYELTRRLYPQWTGRRDRRGIPVYLFEIRHLTNDVIKKYETDLATQPQSESEKEAKESIRMLQLFALYENLLRFVMPLSTSMRDRPHAETTPVSLSNNIVDVSGVGFKQFWNLKGHMQAASELATAHYPETLDRIFIVGAPYFFSTVWGWINRWFDPGTVSKIFILSDKEVKPTLEKYIDPEHIPRKYGGQLDFGWGDMPLIDPAIDATLEWTEEAPVHPKSKKPTLPQGPIRWRAGSGQFDGYHEAVAVGSNAGVLRQSVIARTKGSFGIMRGVTTVTGSVENIAALANGNAEKTMEEGKTVDGTDVLDVRLAHTQLAA